MHQKRNWVQVCVGFGVGVAEGRGVVARVVVGAGCAGGAGSGSGARVVAGAVDAPLFEAEAEAEAVVARVLGRWVADGAGVPVVLGAAVGVAGAAAGPLGDSVLTGRPAPGSAGAVSVPFAVRAATPSPTTARPTTDPTRSPGRRPARRPPRREDGPADGDAAGEVDVAAAGSANACRGTAGVSAGGYAAASGPPTGAGPLAGAPQPGQARAPFRWRRQGAQ
ncbi:hypothetical protein ACFVHB_38080 [Kitasatospora sp. NPDC127111]|uniref:hypothetical protein n=1 Tax=Kitasatospora sp. NPDC127111 TaxID=3345363 RepID=UPI00362F1131